VRINEERYETACENLEQLSAVGWNENVNLPGNHFTWLNAGYDTITNYLSSKISKNSIRFNEAITNIDWSTKTNKITTISQVNQTLKTYFADYVISTIPLGVLKENYKTMFSPSLGLKANLKANAIENLGFGIVNKIFIVYDRPVLSSGGIQVLWRNDVNFSLSNSNKKWNLNVRNETCIF
jgi:monoamine oxidase